MKDPYYPIRAGLLHNSLGSSDKVYMILLLLVRDRPNKTTLGGSNVFADFIGEPGIYTVFTANGKRVSNNTSNLAVWRIGSWTSGRAANRAYEDAQRIKTQGGYEVVINGIQNSLYGAAVTFGNIIAGRAPVKDVSNLQGDANNLRLLQQINGRIVASSGTSSDINVADPLPGPDIDTAQATPEPEPEPPKPVIGGRSAREKRELGI